MSKANKDFSSQDQVTSDPLVQDQATDNTTKRDQATGDSSKRDRVTGDSSKRDRVTGDSSEWDRAIGDSSKQDQATRDLPSSKLEDPASRDLSTRIRQAHERLYALSDFEQRRLAPYRETHYNLNGIRWLLRELDYPQRRFKSIHIAGTKGKGSTLFYVQKLLLAAGKRVGAYTSPHIFDIRERFMLDGAPLDWPVLLPPLEKILFLLYTDTDAEKSMEMDRLSSHISSADSESDRPHITLFDVWTATACMIFAEAEIDVAIMETGLGGRWDSTNILRRQELLAVLLTRIDYDHMDKLGTTLPEIAGEKAEIIKPQIPVFYLSRASQPLPSALKKYGVDEENETSKREAEGVAAVFEAKARSLAAPITAVSPVSKRIDQAAVRARALFPQQWLPALFHENFALALNAVEAILPGPKNVFSEETLASIFTAERPLGRCTQMGVTEGRENIILDGAHTPLSLAKLIEEIEGAPFRAQFSHITFGFYAFFDKAIETLVDMVPAEWDFAFCHIRLPFIRSERRLEVCTRARTTREQHQRSFREIEDLRTLCVSEDPDRLFVFAGSFKLVAAVVQELLGQTSVFPGERGQPSVFPAKEDASPVKEAISSTP